MPNPQCKPGDLVIVVDPGYVHSDAWAVGMVLTIACACPEHFARTDGTYWRFTTELRHPSGYRICCGADSALRPIRPPRPGQVTQQPRELEAA